MVEKANKASKKGSGEQRRRRRVRPCANHPMVPAVTRCEVCGKPICKKCAAQYEGPVICGEECWNAVARKDYKRASAEDRRLRKKKEKKVDRAVTIGMWAVALAVLGVIAAVVLVKMADHTGEKLWEISDSGYSHNYATDPYSTTICFASYDGTIKAINSLTGATTWTVNLPDGERPSHPHMIDDDTVLVRSGNKMFLCSSSKSVPLWEFTAPQPAIQGDPVIRNGRLFLVSSSSDSYYGGYLYGGRDMAPLAGLLANAMSGASRSPESSDEEDRETTVSTITAVDMDSGRALWNTELKDVKIAGLLADGDQVYAAGSRPVVYREQVESSARQAKEDPDEDEEEMMGATQLWALDIDAGEPRWKQEGTGSFLISPILSDEGIVFATLQSIYLVSPAGNIKWKHPLTKEYLSSIKPNGDTLLFSTAAGLLKCLDLESGEKKWTVLTGITTSDIMASYDLVCVPGMVEVNKEPRKVIPTKRWKGSEDLLEQALKTSGAELEPILIGIEPQTGDTRWTIRKIEGEFEYADGIVYTLTHHTRSLLLDATADPSELFGEHTTLAAYDATTGERLWQQGIDGRAWDLRLAFGVALIVARPITMSVAADSGGPVSIRLIAISLQ